MLSRRRPGLLCRQHHHHYRQSHRRRTSHLPHHPSPLHWCGQTDPTTNLKLDDLEAGK